VKETADEHDGEECGRSEDIRVAWNACHTDGPQQKLRRCSYDGPLLIRQGNEKKFSRVVGIALGS